VPEHDAVRSDVRVHQPAARAVDVGLRVEAHGRAADRRGRRQADARVPGRRTRPCRRSEGAGCGGARAARHCGQVGAGLFAAPLGRRPRRAVGNLPARGAGLGQRLWRPGLRGQHAGHGRGACGRRAPAAPAGAAGFAHQRPRRRGAARGLRRAGPDAPAARRAARHLRRQLPEDACTWLSARRRLAPLQHGATRPVARCAPARRRSLRAGEHAPCQAFAAGQAAGPEGAGVRQLPAASRAGCCACRCAQAQGSAHAPDHRVVLP